MRPVTLIFVLSIMLISSCIGTQYDRSAIQQKKEYIVALEEQKTGQHATFSHPAHIDVMTMRKMLKGFNYVRKVGVFNEQDSGPVFQQTEIDRLAGPLVSALAKADNTHYVRFASLNKKKKLMVMTTYQQTEGILFKDAQSRINFVFSNINSQVSSDDPISLQAAFTEKDPLLITRSDVKLTSQSPAFQAYVSDSGKSFPMWMTVSLEKLADTKTVSPKTAVSEPGHSSQKQVVETTPITPAKTDLQKEIKEKLIYFKGLLDDGLITDDDYNARKKLLLDKLE